LAISKLKLKGMNLCIFLSIHIYITQLKKLIHFPFLGQFPRYIPRPIVLIPLLPILSLLLLHRLPIAARLLLIKLIATNFEIDPISQ